MEDVALFFRLLGAFSFVAGTVVAGAASEVARRRDDPAAGRRCRRPARRALSYDAVADQYVLVWKTDRAWAGTAATSSSTSSTVRGTRPLVLAPWDGCDSVDGDTCTVRIKAGLNFATTGAYAP